VVPGSSATLQDHCGRKVGVSPPFPPTVIITAPDGNETAGPREACQVQPDKRDFECLRDGLDLGLAEKQHADGRFDDPRMCSSTPVGCPVNGTSADDLRRRRLRHARPPDDLQGCEGPARKRPVLHHHRRSGPGVQVLGCSTLIAYLDVSLRGLDSDRGVWHHQPERRRGGGNEPRRVKAAQPFRTWSRSRDGWRSGAKGSVRSGDPLRWGGARTRHPPRRGPCSAPG